MKKVYAILLILVLCTGLVGCGSTDDESRLFTAKELQNTEMYRYDYWNSESFEIPAEVQEPLKKVLSEAAVVEIMAIEEPVEPEGYCIFLKGKKAEYLFCFEDAEEYISVENPHRYIPLLKVQKTLLKSGAPSETQAWICSLDAASYSKALNLSYNYDILLEGWDEYMKPDAEKTKEETLCIPIP